MPHSTLSIRSSLSYAASNYDRSSTPSPNSISTAATSIASAAPRLIPANQKRPVIKPRKPRPKSQPGDWHQLLGIPVDTNPGGSNASSRVSSIHTTDSYADLLSQGSFQTEASTPTGAPTPTGAMGGSRTSVNMSAPLDAQAHRRQTSYEEQYQYKDNAHGTVRERVHKESPVIAELRTNVIIKDEFTLVTDMSYHLAARYTRPDSSIMINVDHSSCLALGGTFDPCYILTLSLVPSQMQATTNKRNAALIQSFMADILSVPPERGIVKFVAIPEENFAVNGSTLFGEIERLEQQQLSGNSGVKRAMTDVRKSMPAFKSKNSIPKFDTEFAKNVDKADGFDGLVEDLQNAIMPAPLKPKPELPQVFEVARPRGDDDRSSTSHGQPSSAPLDGLRLNGIAKGDLEGPGTKTPYGRPKTVGGRPVHPSAEISSPPRRSSDEAAPAPTVKSSDSRKHKSSKSETVSSSNIPTNSSTPPPIASPTERTKPAYLDNAAPKSALAHSRSRSKSQSPPHALPQAQAQEPANTAKRRSTVNNSATVTATATAKNAPQPPPVPETKPAKVSKRKSFMSAFKHR